MTTNNTNDEPTGTIRVSVKKESSENDTLKLSYHSTLRGEFQEVGVGPRAQTHIVSRLTDDDDHSPADYEVGTMMAEICLTRSGEIESVEWHEPPDNRKLALIRRLESDRFDLPVVTWKWADGSETMTDSENRTMCRLLDEAAERRDLDQFDIGEIVAKAWLIDGDLDVVEWK